jgi:hypothetical protein
MTKQQRKIRSQPDMTFDKTPQRKLAAGSHGTKSKELNTQTYAAGTRALGGGQGPGIEP